MRYSDECYFAVFLLIVLLWAILHCRRKSSHASENNDHGTTNDDNHIIITIKKLTGINPSVLRSIPIVDFDSKDFKETVECVICLSELVDGDKTRVLPTCNHLFHVDCIDSWFLSHSTCPICRSEILGIPMDSSPMSTEAVADCGGADEGSSGLTAVVIDIS